MLRTRSHALQAAAVLAGSMTTLLFGCASNSEGGAATQACLSDPEDLAQRHANAASDYAACANTANLRAMAANPADLDQGRPLGPANGEREALAVRTYEQGLVKPLGQTGTQSPAGATGGGQ